MALHGALYQGGPGSRQDLAGLTEAQAAMLQQEANRKRSPGCRRWTSKLARSQPDTGAEDDEDDEDVQAIGRTSVRQHSLEVPTPCRTWACALLCRMAARFRAPTSAPALESLGLCIWSRALPLPCPDRDVARGLRPCTVWSRTRICHTEGQRASDCEAVKRAGCRAIALSRSDPSSRIPTNHLPPIQHPQGTPALWR